jgi:hypothetical protein
VRGVRLRGLRREKAYGLTRIPCLTVGAKVVAGNVVEEVLQALFVARLLALA